MARERSTRFYSDRRDERGFPAAGVVLAEFRAIYIPIPKVANTSLKAALMLALDLSRGRSSRNGDIAAVVHVDANWEWVDHETLRNRYADWFTFAFVRNPWDRLLSCFRSKVHPDRMDDPVLRRGLEPEFWKYGDAFHGEMTFTDFVRATAAIPDAEADIHFASQHLHVIDDSGQVVVDFLGRFESLADDFATVSKRIGLRAHLPHLLPSEHSPYGKYYTAETSELVGERWARDAELFGYRFD